jgi:hypothetical protein
VSSVRRLLVAALAAASLTPMAAAPASAAIPSSGTLAEGLGPSAALIGSPGRAAVARWSLVCAPIFAGSVGRRCYSSLTHAVNWVEYGGDGRIQAVVFSEGGWRTSHGVGLGSRISAVKAAYGKSLEVRRTPVWTYLTLHRQVRGQLRSTQFLGRTRFGDVVQLSVVRERRMLVDAVPAPVPPDQGFTVRLRDFDPRQAFPVTLAAPWETAGFGEDLGTVPVGLGGTGSLAVTRAVAGALLAQRPAGTAGPVVMRLAAGGGAKAPHGSVSLTLPAPPTIAVDAMPLPRDGTARVLLSGGEAGGSYELDAEWTCASGGARRSQRENLDDLGTPRGGAASSALDPFGLSVAVFAADCAGAAPPPTLPVTLVLMRIGVGVHGASVSRERVAQAVVAVEGRAAG